jgi:glucuronate isomerase
MCTLARELPNLSLAGAWWHNFFPDAIGQVLRERLEMLPTNKQIGFFSDAYCAEWSYAKAVLVRKLLARVLAEGVDRGQYTRSEAVAIARAIVFEKSPTPPGMAPSEGP